MKKTKPAVKTSNGLSSEVRTKAAAILNQHLPAAIDLHGQVKQAHWNVRGAQFIALHELFDEISDEVDEWIDSLAERAGALGAAAEGTVQVAAKHSYLEAYPLRIASGPDHLRALGKALAGFTNKVRKAIDEAADLGDANTADLLTGISRSADQALWKVESHKEPA